MLKPVIEIITNEGRKKMMLTGEAVSVGRAVSNSIAFNDHMMSRQHCVFDIEDGGISVRDLGSQNGTFVNNQKIDNVKLVSGDIVTIGSIEIRFTMQDVATRKAPKKQRKGMGGLGTMDARPTAAPPGSSATDAAPVPASDALEAPMKQSRVSPLMGGGDANALPPANAPREYARDSVDMADSAARPVHNAVPMESDDGGPQGTDDFIQSPTGHGKRTAPQFGPSEDEVDLQPPPVQSEDIQYSDAELVQAVIAHARRLDEIIESLPEDDDTIDEDMLLLINSRGQYTMVPEIESAEEAVVSGKDAMLFLRGLLYMCLRLRATDLHMELKERGYHVRLRVDGMMVDIMHLHPGIGLRFQRLVKIQADIDIADPSAIQEGHFSVDVPGRKIHYRVSFTPSIRGQKLVIRVLDVGHAPTDIAQLGFPSWMKRELLQVVHQNAGMLLVCGPTGSGKTTTLYSLIRAIDRQTRNVVTIEDPVEYEIEGTTQLPINDVHGHSFSTLLRSVLRQDPDVLLIGEIRDAETANIAMRAAVTGHVVFSTVHARDSVGTIFRLLDLGVESNLLGSALNLVLAQRLARRLCENCKTQRRLEPFEMRSMAKHGVEGVGHAFEPQGCPKCLETGYAGRKAFFELMTTNDQLRDVILSSPQIQEIRRVVQATLFSSLHKSGYELVKDGICSMDEIERVVGQA